MSESCSVRSCGRKPARSTRSGKPYCVTHAEQRADKLFSAWIRSRDLDCTARGMFGLACSGVLQAAHRIGRRNQRVRYDTSNVAALCQAHHRFVDQHAQLGAKIQWTYRTIGKDAWDDLVARSRQVTKRHEAALAALAWLEGETP